MSNNAPRHALATGRRCQVGIHATTLCLALLATLPPDGVGAEPKPGARREVIARGQAGKLSVIFHYCPAGKIRPGAPLAPAAETPAKKPASKAQDPLAGVLDDAVPIAPFYMSETEITIPQFRVLLGDDRLEAVASRFPKLQSAGDLKQMIQAGGEFPLYLATAEDAAAFCEAMRAGYVPSAHDDSGGIVALQFRIPTHHEWQYACRAVTDVAAQERAPHFNGWPDGVEALDRNTRSKCEEEWKSLGRDPGEFRGTQEQVIFIVENSKTGGTVPLEILSAFLKAGTGVSRNYALNRPGKVAVVASTQRANPWGLFDMHENVHEWVIAASASRADVLSRELNQPASLSAGSRQEKVFLLAGGSFNALMTGSASGWKTFTVWGSKPSDVKGAPQPFSLDDEGDSHAKTQEYEPGFRVVMRRALSDGWLLAVRQDAVLNAQPAPDALARLSAKRTAALEVADKAQAAEVTARVAYYEGLIQYRMGRSADGSTAVQAARRALPPAPTSTRRLSRLASALANGPGSERPPAQGTASEEDVFLDTLATLMGQDR